MKKLICTFAAFLLVASLVQTADAQRRSSSRTSGRNATAVKETLTELVGDTAASVCRVESDGDELSLGTVVAASGLIVTKHSEVELVDEIKCVFESGQTYDAEVVASHPDYDLALLRIEGEGLSPVTLSEEEIDINAGSIVLSPDDEGEPISMGLISVDPRRFNMRQPNVRRGYLGVECAPVDSGLRINNVTSRSGARRAGLQADDIIVEFEDDRVATVDNLIQKLSGFRPGDEVSILILRDEEEMEVTATLGQVPSNGQQDQWGGGPFSAVRFGFPQVIAHDSVIRPEQCGGPLLNSDGEVIGINIARALRVATYAVPTQIVAEFVDENREAGK
ncbi:MAG: trypsin-like peptidase domain-containing protein [Planctomycetota bacterium]